MGSFINSYFLRISISRKLLLGYGVLLLLLIVISAYSLFNLHWLNAINNGILNSDLPVINATEKMIGIILDQEFYAQRYRILPKKENLARFRQRQAEFKQIADQIASLPNDRDLMIDPIVQLRSRYSEILSEGLLLPNGAGAWIAENYEQKIKTHQENIITLIRAMATDAIRDQKQKTNMTTSIGNLAFKVSASKGSQQYIQKDNLRLKKRIGQLQNKIRSLEASNNQLSKTIEMLSTLDSRLEEKRSNFIKNGSAEAK
ncbi:MAG: hypothetical protein JSW26_04635 [Desulfobacterales bacterium]|nr:MAG: hypothetical protein JSW26_04635 [Desulfobacterales bacterium]